MGCNYVDLKSKEKIAIIDANNFYVSCERLFQPKWNGKPTAVLSNNDGCFIARSNEVKKMGIKMGQPKFLLDDSVQKEIKMFSSNYSLYGDMSDRVVNILKRLVPRVEVYSIDESFLDLSHIDEKDIQGEILRIKTELTRLTGIPFSIGVAPTKTLAKLCNYLSKNNPDMMGVCSYWSIDKDTILNLPVDEVWGIGRGYRNRLQNLNVKNVREFIDLSDIQVRKLLGVVGQRTWFELNEVICSPISEEFKKSKGITSTRSFGSSQWHKDQILDAFWTQLQHCHRKLLKDDSEVIQIIIFATYGRFTEDSSCWSRRFTIPQQTDKIEVIWSYIRPLLDELPTHLWEKCGVIFNHVRPKGKGQLTLFIDQPKLQPPPETEDQQWMTRRDLLSDSWTTDWNQLYKIK